MKRNQMSKTAFNGIHLDLFDISLIGQLTKNAEGVWFAPVVWRNTGQTINLKMAKSTEAYAILLGDEENRAEKEANENYERLVRGWMGCE